MEDSAEGKAGSFPKAGTDLAEKSPGQKNGMRSLHKNEKAEMLPEADIGEGERINSAHAGLFTGDGDRTEIHSRG